MPKCVVRQLGRVGYGAALELQLELVRQRQEGLIPDQLLLLEHPHVITIGRNGKAEHVLVSLERLRQQGIELWHTDRGGDVTYHGPGQLVGYPIIDLKEWKRDVVAYVRALEEVLIRALLEFHIPATRRAGVTGVWVEDRKIAAIGVHISRWVTYHGFALNVETDLRYFQYIVPCGLPNPVTSMRQEGSSASMETVSERVAHHFGRVFDRELQWQNIAMGRIA